MMAAILQRGLALFRETFLLPLVVVLSSSGSTWAADTVPLQAGVARVNLTPPSEMRVAFGGYEASMSFYGETLGSTMVEGIVRAADGLK